MGTGYVGLASGACLSSLGHTVVCLDIDEAKISLLRNGQIPIVENGLAELVTSGIAMKTLSFTTEISESIPSADVVFLCLPTPQDDDGSADLSYVEKAVADIRTELKPGAILVNKSTVPVGTAVRVQEILKRDDVHVVSNPEFLRQGTAVHDFLHPSRVVIGGDNESATAAVAALYAGVDAPILQMKTASAEALKYAANAFLATKLTFINAMADICEAVGADIFDVAAGIGMDPRIGSDMLRAGPGWGGSCFPKDTRALVSIAADGGYDFALLRGVIETNDQHYARIADKVIEECGGSVAGKVVASWGLTFKAETDDLRDSPAIKILTVLHEAGAIVRAYDPTAKKPYVAYPWIQVATSALEVCEGADVLAVLTEWNEFVSVDPQAVGQRLQAKMVVDGRNVLNREAWQAAGFTYRGVGR
ncbi:MAG: nucleotide sugar dehydrogenase [Actinobacteria bacterium]|nr:nucleotide sugar dehydrogenase [Actinomycetota bacterium]